MLVSQSSPADIEKSLVEYHVVYSPSYQVPVVYFRLLTSNGGHVSLDTVYENLITQKDLIKGVGLQGAISQGVRRCRMR
jgi:hypothetical protein